MALVLLCRLSINLISINLCIILLYLENMKDKIKYLILILAIASCAFGIYIGEMEVVFGKAIKICLECCGIG